MQCSHLVQIMDQHWLHLFGFSPLCAVNGRCVRRAVKPKLSNQYWAAGLACPLTSDQSSVKCKLRSFPFSSPHKALAWLTAPLLRYIELCVWPFHKIIFSLYLIIITCARTDSPINLIPRFWRALKINACWSSQQTFRCWSHKVVVGVKRKLRKREQPCRCDCSS